MFERRWLGLPPLPVRVMPKKRVVEPITTPEMLEEERVEQSALYSEPKRDSVVSKRATDGKETRGRKRATDGKEHEVATLFRLGFSVNRISAIFGSRMSIIRDVLASQGML